MIDYTLSTSDLSEFCRFWFLQDKEELVWWLYTFFSCFLIVGWLTLAMLAGFDPGGQSGPVFHSEACWRRCRGPSGCVVDGLGNFWLSLDFAFLLRLWVFFCPLWSSFFFPRVFPPPPPMMKSDFYFYFSSWVWTVWSAIGLSFYITLLIHIWLIKHFIWTSIMVVYMCIKSNPRPHIHSIYPFYEKTQSLWKINLNITIIQYCAQVSNRHSFLYFVPIIYWNV